MALSDDFKNAVESHDVLMTRIMLKDSMLVDLTLRQFEERLAYAESNMDDLYDEHDDEAFNEDVTSWTEDYLAEQMVKLVNNFSRERIAFLKKMVRKTDSKEAEKADVGAFVADHKAAMSAMQKVGVVGMCGGAAAAVIGIATSHPIVTVAGVAVAAVGGVVYVKGRNE